MKKTLVILVISFSSLFAQSAGNTGLSFLKIGFGARNVAMGDLGVVSTGDMNSTFYNPALIFGNDKAQISFSHNKLIQDVSSEILGVNFSIGDMPFVVGINSTTISDIEVRTQPGPAESTFNAHYFYGTISSGFQLESFSVGLTLKYIYESLFSDEASGFAGDVGIYSNKLIEGVGLGISLRNIGSMSKLREEPTDLPMDLRAGASYSFHFESIKSVTNFVGGLQKYLDNDNLHIHVGAEVVYNEFFSLRGGYISGYDSKSITYGTGILWGSFNFDYAFVPFEFGLGDNHTISVSYTF